MNPEKIKLINQRASFLIRNWNSEFSNRTPYWFGPSKFFYEEIGKELKNKEISYLIQDRNFLKDCYACLLSWGLDRMGRGGPKMKDFEEFCYEIEKNSETIKELSNYRLGNPSINNLEFKIINLFNSTHVIKNKTRLVSNSKLFHFLIPDLFPVVDQQYIVRYFTQKNFNPKTIQALPIKEELAFYLKIIKIYNSLIYKYKIQNNNSLLEIDKAVVNYVNKKLER